MKNKIKEIGILYLSFHNSIKKIYGINRIITKEKLMEKLGRQFLVPKLLRPMAIKEHIDKNLLKQESKNEYKILNSKLDIEKDINKLVKLNNYKDL